LSTALEGVRGQRHAPAALYPRGRSKASYKNTTFMEEVRGNFCGLEVGFDMCIKEQENYTATSD